MLATACSDRFVRVYDRRRLSLRPSSAQAPDLPLMQLAPLHMAIGRDAGGSNRAYSTCARFSHKGDRLVATFHAEQARDGAL